MFSHSETIRVRYGETDQMGYVYYGNYALYYEVGRVELIRKLGISYHELEAQGVAMPVVAFEIKYLKPAKYDEVITIKTTILDIPTSLITFHYECFNEENILINTGKVTLVFTDINTRKPIRCPQKFEFLLKSQFHE